MKIREKFTYANIVSTICLIVVLGSGTAWAATKISGADIKDESITGADLKNGTITGTDIASGALNGTDLADNTVTNSKIAPGAVTTSKIANDAITSTLVSAAAITATKIADGAITTAKIADGAVTAAKLAPGAVPTYSAGKGLTVSNNKFSIHGSGYENVVVVAKSGGDYTTIQGAIDSITDASSDKPYVVWIAPGHYNEHVTMKPYVDLQGASKKSVFIEQPAGNSALATPPLTSIIDAADNTEIAHVTVQPLIANSLLHFNIACIAATSGTFTLTDANLLSHEDGQGDPGNMNVGTMEGIHLDQAAATLDSVVIDQVSNGTVDMTGISGRASIAGGQTPVITANDLHVNLQNTGGGMMYFPVSKGINTPSHAGLFRNSEVSDAVTMHDVDMNDSKITGAVTAQTLTLFSSKLLGGSFTVSNLMQAANSEIYGTKSGAGFFSCYNSYKYSGFSFVARTSACA